MIRGTAATYFKLASFFAAIAVTGCATAPPDQLGRSGAQPLIRLADGGRYSTEISVLTYNVEGLPWPVRKARSARLKEITRILRDLRSKGSGPQVVLLQEAFSGEAARIGRDSGYPNFVRGPSAGSRRPPTSEAAERELIGKRKRLKGEGFRQFLPSGLYILSEFPIVVADRQPFRSRECAGFDCLANKGILYARIVIPGVPEPLEVFNTHLNSRGSSGVAESRSLLAHRLQVEEFSRYVEELRTPAYPLIFGGDFNMRNSPQRFEHFALRQSWPLVHQWCSKPEAACGVGLSWDGDAPWMDSQDLQGFDSGVTVQVRPSKVMPMFDQPWRGKPLSDHDGLLVAYVLHWEKQAPPARN